MCAIQRAMSMLLVGVFLQTFACQSIAEEAVDLKPLADKVETLVKTHYPEAEFVFKDNQIHFEFNTRKYLIHNNFLQGGYGEASEEIGPQAPSRSSILKKQGGIIGDIEICSGEYGGMASLPQVFHRHYFDKLGMAPYSAALNKHLRVNLSYAKDMTEEFETSFKLLMNNFEKELQAGEN